MVSRRQAFLAHLINLLLGPPTTTCGRKQIFLIRWATLGSVGGPVYALNLFDIADREEYLAYSRRSVGEVERHGGRVVASGTPEEVAAVRRSHTGQVLKPLLNGNGKRNGVKKSEPAAGSNPGTESKKVA